MRHFGPKIPEGGNHQQCRTNPEGNDGAAEDWNRFKRHDHQEEKFRSEKLRLKDFLLTGNERKRVNKKLSEVQSEILKERQQLEADSVSAEAVLADSIPVIPETESKESVADSEMLEQEPEMIEQEREETVISKTETAPLSSPSTVGLPKESGGPPSKSGGRGKKAILIPPAPTTPAVEAVGSRY